MTETMRVSAIGPWASSALKSQPTAGRSVRAFGGCQAANWPADGGACWLMSRLR